MAIETSASLARFSSIHPARLYYACIVNVRYDLAQFPMDGRFVAKPYRSHELLGQVDDLNG